MSVNSLVPSGLTVQDHVIWKSAQSRLGKPVIGRVRNEQSNAGTRSIGWFPRASRIHCSLSVLSLVQPNEPSYTGPWAPLPTLWNELSGTRSFAHFLLVPAIYFHKSWCVSARNKRTEGKERAVQGNQVKSCTREWVESKGGRQEDFPEPLE